MESVKDILNFCKSAILHDYKIVVITCELNQVRKCINNSFYKTIPDSRIRVSLSMIDDITLTIHDNDIEITIENIHDLRENKLYILSFEKLNKDEQQTITPILNDNDE